MELCSDYNSKLPVPQSSEGLRLIEKKFSYFFSLDQAVIYDIANHHMHQNISNNNEQFKRKMHLGISRVGVEKWIGYFDKK